MSDRSEKHRKSTKSLNQQHTAWFQLMSAAGSLMDRFRGSEVTDANREDLWVLRDCVNRVMELEGMTERPDNREYDVELGESDRKDAR